MHEALVVDGNGNYYVCEPIFLYSLDGEQAAEILVVMPPEDHVLERLQTWEERLQNRRWEGVRLHPLCDPELEKVLPQQCSSCTLLTFFCPLLAALPELFLRVSLADHGVLLAVHAYRNVSPFSKLKA